MRRSRRLPAAWSRWLTANLFTARAPSGMTWCATSGWRRRQNPRRCRIVIRPAVISPTIADLRSAQQALIACDPIACDSSWRSAISAGADGDGAPVPEADRSGGNFGKRDCADAGPPQPIAHYRVTASSCAARGVDRQYRHHGSALHAAPGAAAMCRSAIFCCSAPHPCSTLISGRRCCWSMTTTTLDELDTLF